MKEHWKRKTFRRRDAALVLTGFCVCVYAQNLFGVMLTLSWPLYVVTAAAGWLLWYGKRDGRKKHKKIYKRKNNESIQ